MRGFEAEALSGTMVETVLNDSELLGAHGGKVHALGKVPTEKTDDVLHGTLLPRTVGIAEEDGYAEGLVLCVLRPAVERERAPEHFLESAQALLHGTLSLGCGFVSALREEDESAASLLLHGDDGSFLPPSEH